MINYRYVFAKINKLSEKRQSVSELKAIIKDFKDKIFVKNSILKIKLKIDINQNKRFNKIHQYFFLLGLIKTNFNRNFLSFICSFLLIYKINKQ